MRAGYETDCRFFENRPDLVSRIKWIRKLPSAPVLGIPSGIYARFQDPYPWESNEFAEVWRVKHNYSDPPPIVGATGEHYCGTAKDHLEGATWAADLPIVTYNSRGLPQCCVPAPTTTGGIGLGGISHPFATTPPIGPGATCETAGIVPIGPTVYSSTLAVAATDWWAFDVVIGNTYKLTMTHSPLVFFNRVVLSGTCDGGFSTVFTPLLTGCVTYTATATERLYFTLFDNLGIPVSYTWSIDNGACP